MNRAMILAARALVEDFLEEYPTIGYEEPETVGPDAAEGVELLERLLIRHRLELVDVDAPRAAGA